VRLLIDYATGVYTGSILDDQSLIEALPGQGRCDKSVRTPLCCFVVFGFIWLYLDVPLLHLALFGFACACSCLCVCMYLCVCDRWGGIDCVCVSCLLCGDWAGCDRYRRRCIIISPKRPRCFFNPQTKNNAPRCRLSRRTRTTSSRAASSASRGTRSWMRSTSSKCLWVHVCVCVRERERECVHVLTCRMIGWLVAS
jgi:hypothetical protein